MSMWDIPTVQAAGDLVEMFGIALRLLTSTATACIPRLTIRYILGNGDFYRR